MRIERRERSEASILHADLDSFYASVEQRDDPRLRGRPVIVGGGVVVAASYEAKACGVRTPMPGRQARALCPDAIVVPARFGAYMEASREVFEIFDDLTPLVEGISVDEAFLDVGGLGRIAGSPVTIATRLRERVADEVGLPISVGIARTKFLAKVASAFVKPDGLLEVPPERELEFLHPLPVRRLWGVGAVTEKRLADAGLSTVGQLADLGERGLTAVLGQAAGRHLYALSMARDPRPVETGRRRRSIGAQRALGRGRHEIGDVALTLAGLSDRVSQRLRRADRVARTVVLRLRFDDFGRATRSRTLAEPTDRTDIIVTAARELLDEAAPLLHDRGCTLVGISLSNLDPADAVQLALPFEPERNTDLDAAMDSLRERFGRDTVTRAALLHRPIGDDAPMLPD